MTQQAFICRAKPDGKTDLSEQSLSENTLFYGLPDIPGLLDRGHTVESMKLAIRAVHPEYIPLREAKMFWIFSRAMATGAIVLTPQRRQGETVYYIGQTSGEAHYLAEAACSATAYRRPVHWHNDKAPLRKADLPTGLIEKINAPYNVTRTCLDISEFGTGLRNLIRF